MPANKKYLVGNPYIRYTRALIATLGTLLTCIGIVLSVGKQLDSTQGFLLTFSYAFFLLWVALMILTFLITSFRSVLIAFLLALVCSWIGILF